MYSRLETLIDSILKECSLIMEIAKDVTEESDLGKTIEDIKTFRAICMGEQNIGEAVVQLDHLTQGRLFELYPDIDWRSVKGMKNHIVHEYLDIDERAIIATAKKDIPKLETTVQQIKEDIVHKRLNKLLFYIELSKKNKKFKIPPMQSTLGKNR